MKILITGSAGFIGGYLVEELLAAGYVGVAIEHFGKYGPAPKKQYPLPN